MLWLVLAPDIDVIGLQYYYVRGVYLRCFLQVMRHNRGLQVRVLGCSEDHHLEAKHAKNGLDSSLCLCFDVARPVHMCDDGTHRLMDFVTRGLHQDDLD